MEIYLARQPILTSDRMLFGYEVLFRSSQSPVFDGKDPDRCTMQVINNTYFLLGIERLAGGRRLFINFTRQTLLSDCALILPPDSLVVEVLEDVEPDDEILRKCRELKQAGYVIALDDFIGGRGAQPLAELADIIKVDFGATTPEQRAVIAAQHGGRGARLLAEKVETVAEFEQARDLGFSFFQGYFFAKPVLLSGRGIPAAKLNYLALLAELNQPDVDFDSIERIVKREVSLCYMLLRHINSAAFGLKTRVGSLKQALLMLGLRGVKQWASIILLAGLAQETPVEVVITSAVRAKFCEVLAREARCADRAADLFLVGLFSLLDTIISRPLEEVLAQLALPEDCKRALLGADSTLGRVLRLVVAYERGEWERVSKLATVLGVSEAALPGLYLAAVESTAGVGQIAA